MDDSRNNILQFIKPQLLTVLSTVSPDGVPESATVECAVTDEFEVVFDTFRSFRKYRNLCNNPNVALVFGCRDDVTVQLEGCVRLLDGELLDYYQTYYLRRIPSAKKFAENPEVSWFCVTPRWIRYTDVSKEPWKVLEVNF